MREGTEVGTHQRLSAPKKRKPSQKVPVGADSPGMGLAGCHRGSAWTGGTFTDAAVGRRGWW